MPVHVFSLSEKTLMEVHESHGPTLFSHNRNYLMRAYPSGLRVSSSNLDPSVFWRKGVQMVALNWQKWDEGMMLNEGMFAGEGGWVLKPKGYRSSDKGQTETMISNESQADAIAHKTLELVVEVYAGQAIPLPIGDESLRGFHPYLKCELHVERPEERTGAPIEGGGRSKDGEYKRRTKTKRGIEPDFGGERLEFSRIPGVVEGLSFLRFEIPFSFSVRLPNIMQSTFMFHQSAKQGPGSLKEYRNVGRYRILPGDSRSGPLRCWNPRLGVEDRETSCDAISKPRFRFRVTRFANGFRLGSNRVKIHDDEIGKDDLAAWACIRLDRLQEGFRFLHLLNAKGEETPGLLLVKITKLLSQGR